MSECFLSVSVSHVFTNYGHNPFHTMSRSAQYLESKAFLTCQISNTLKREMWES